jgi:hypothetical protein
MHTAHDTFRCQTADQPLDLPPMAELQRVAVVSGVSRAQIGFIGGNGTEFRHQPGGGGGDASVRMEIQHWKGSQQGVPPVSAPVVKFDPKALVNRGLTMSANPSARPDHPSDDAQRLGIDVVPARITGVVAQH